MRALDLMGDAAAYATYTLAREPKLPRGEPAPPAAQRQAAAGGSRYNAATLHGGAETGTRQPTVLSDRLTRRARAAARASR